MNKKRFQAKRKSKQTPETGKSKFKRGFYKPLNEGKYQQPLNDYMNSGPYPEYRSSWELKLYKWCDNSDIVEYWTTEAFAIPYLKPTDGQIHRYFPDVLVKFTDGRMFLIEVKPKSQVQDDVVQAKAKAAIKFCEGRNITFIFMTEKELGVK